MRILVFGDSIAYGEYDSQGGWVDRLKTTYLEERFIGIEEDLPIIYNLGVHGTVTRHLTYRLGQEVVVRRSPWEEATEFVLVFAAGINDSLTYDTGKHFSSLERYIQDLEDLLAVARLFSDKLLFIGLTPVDDENPRTRNYHTERIWQFEQVLRRFTQNHALPFVPLFEKLQARMQEEYVFIDGLHPSDEGHQLIYEQVLPVLQSLAVDTPAYTDILGA